MKAQFILTNLASNSTKCYYPWLVVFHPSINDLLAVACYSNPDYIALYQVSANGFLSLSNLTLQTQLSLRGLKFSPANNTRALATFSSLNILTLTEQSIYIECSYVSTTNSFFNVDLTPSGSNAVVAALDSAILYNISQYNITQLMVLGLMDVNNCYDIFILTEKICFLQCNYYGIYQLAITNEQLIQQQFYLSQKEVYGMTLIKGLNNTGLYSAILESQFYSFKIDSNSSYSYTIIESQILLNYSAITYNPSFNADGSMIALAAIGSITLYNFTYAPNCAESDSQTNCIGCKPGYYSPSQNCNLSCNKNCLTCSLNSSQCDTCVQSNPLRILSQICTCPLHYYDDGINAQCQSCTSLACTSCTNSTSCESCVDGQLNRAPAQNCSCPELKYFDPNPLQPLDCQSCLAQCLTCTDNQSCTACVGNNQSRQLPDCSCQQGFYSNLNLQDDCLPCPILCATCSDQLQCTSCITTQNYSLELYNGSCICLMGYFSDQLTQNCLACPNTCQSCTNSSFCTLCTTQIFNGYFILQDQQGENCQTDYSTALLANDTKQTKCCNLFCNTGYFIDTNFCAACDTNCATCSLKADLCTSCHTNFTLSNNSCICRSGYYIENGKCIIIEISTAFASNTPILSFQNDANDNFVIITMTFPVPLLQVNNDLVLNVLVQIAGLTIDQQYNYSIIANDQQNFQIKIQLFIAIGHINIVVSFPNTYPTDTNNMLISLPIINYPFGPQLNTGSGADKQIILKLQNLANQSLDSSLMEGLRAIAFLSYFLVSVQITFAFLLINMIYPQNFYEVLRLLSSGYISNIPQYNQLNLSYSYQLFYTKVNLNLQQALDFQFYRLGFTGQILFDQGKQILSLISLSIFFLVVICNLCKHFRQEIENGNKKFLRSAYFFFLETIIKMHESIFGLTIYSLLLAFSCIQFTSFHGIINFIVAIVLICYIYTAFYNVWQQLNTNDILTNDIQEKFAPLLSRQEISENQSSQLGYKLKKNFQLLNYYKKFLVIISIYYGQGSAIFQLISVIIIYSANLGYVLYLRPYKSYIYMCIKVLTECTLITVCIILLITNQKINQIVQQAIVSEQDCERINNLGWAAAWLLCTFNILCLIMMLTDYAFEVRAWLLQSNNNIKFKQDKSQSLVLKNIKKDIEMSSEHHKGQLNANANIGGSKANQELKIPFNIKKQHGNSKIRDINTNFDIYQDKITQKRQLINLTKFMSVRDIVKVNWTKLMQNLNEYEYDLLAKNSTNNELMLKFTNQSQKVQSDLKKFTNLKIFSNTIQYNEVIDSLKNFMQVYQKIIQQDCDLCTANQLKRQILEIFKENNIILQLLYDQEEVTFSEFIDKYGEKILRLTQIFMQDIEQVLQEDYISNNTDQDNSILQQQQKALKYFSLIKICLLCTFLFSQQIGISQLTEVLQSIDEFLYNFRYQSRKILRQAQNELLYWCKISDQFQKFICKYKIRLFNIAKTLESHSLPSILQQAAQLIFDDQLLNKDFFKDQIKTATYMNLAEKMNFLESQMQI